MQSEEPANISFYNQSFDFEESKDIQISKEGQNNINKVQQQNNKCLQLIEKPSKCPSTLQFSTQSKDESQQTHDIEFKQTAKFFHPTHEQSFENSKEDQSQGFMKGRGISLFATPTDVQLNEFYQLSLSGQDNQMQKKMNRKEKISLNNQIIEQKKFNSPTLIQRNFKNGSQSKMLHQQGTSQEGVSPFDTNEFISNETVKNMSEQEDIVKIPQNNKEKRQMQSRQLIPIRPLFEKNPLNVLSQSIQKFSSNNECNSNGNQIQNLQNDPCLNNFLKQINDKQVASLKKSQQNVNVQQKITQSALSQSKVLPFAQQPPNIQNKDSISGLFFKPNLKLTDDVLTWDQFKDINQQTCQSKLNQDFKEKIIKDKEILNKPPQLSTKQNSNMNNNINFFSGQKNKVISQDFEKQFGFSNNCEQQSILYKFSQMGQLVCQNKQSIPVQQQQRKGSAPCFDDIQKNLQDNCLMQSLKKQQIQFENIRQKQIKNFEDLYSNTNNEINYANIQQRQDIKGQLLFSSQQDSRRSRNNSTQSDHRLYQFNTDEKRHPSFQSINSEDSNIKQSQLYFNSIKKDKPAYQNEINELYGSLLSSKQGNVQHKQITTGDDINQIVDKDYPILNNNNLFYRHSLVNLNSNNNNFLRDSKCNGLIKSKQNDDQNIQDKDLVRRSIKQSINKEIQIEITPTLPQLPINNGSIYSSSAQKRVEQNGNNLQGIKRQYQQYNIVNPELIQKPLYTQNYGDEQQISERETHTADTNYSYQSKSNQVKTFLQRKPQENILNKIFHYQNEVSVE